MIGEGDFLIRETESGCLEGRAVAILSSKL